MALHPTPNVRGKPNPQARGDISSSKPTFDAKGLEPSRTAPHDDSGVQSVSNSSVLLNVQKALSLSLIACLIKTGTWIPLGALSCVRNAPPRALMRRQTENRPAFPPSEILLMSVVVECVPSTELVISSSYSILPGLRRLSEVLLGRRQDGELVQSSKILICPSGQVGLYRGLASASEENADTDSEAAVDQAFDHRKSPNDPYAENKRSIASRLAQRGIEVSDQEYWVRLQYTGPSSISDVLKGDPHCSPPFTFLWPSSLCFCIPGTFPHEERWSHCLTFGQDSCMDPLLYAETWFMGKAGRTLPMKASRKTVGEEEQNSEDEEDPIGKDAFADLVPRLTQYGSTQDIASIYPTPPDGVPSQATISNQRPAQSSYGDGLGKRHLDSVEGGTHLVGSPLTSNLDPIISSTTYDQLEDDLYAELDNDLFAANGLTEADLDFFDEPNSDNKVVVPEVQETSLRASNEKPEVLNLHWNLDSIGDVASESAMDVTNVDSMSGPGTKVLDRGTINLTLFTVILTQLPRCRPAAFFT